MGFNALYRTYRPQRFEELIGQEPITKTLSNALKSGKTSHAYIFSGPRGTGKTSTARLFAKALNCEEGMGKTCGKCPNCLSLANGTHPDVIEIDAASNNGVKEVRNIIEQVKFSPIRGKFKVYIIDEVHMMTKEAFNSLLKTLEEPPEDVIFILCTTEFSKIPQTIVSRCQKFEFQKISIKDISTKLKEVCTKENFKFTEEGLESIASISEGCLRDALTKLDEISSYTEGNITTEKIEEFYSLSSKSFVLNFCKNILQKNIEKIMDLLHEIFNRDFDIKYLSDCLLKILKDLLIFNLSKSPKYFEYLNEEENKEFSSLNINQERIKYCINKLMEMLKALKDATNINILFELTIYEMCSDSTITEQNIVQNTQLENNHETKVDVKQNQTNTYRKVEVNIEEKTVDKNFTLDWLNNSSSSTVPKNSTSVSSNKKSTIDDDLLIKLLCTGNKEMRQKVNALFEERISNLVLDEKYKNEALILKDCQIAVLSNKLLIVTTLFNTVVESINKNQDKFKDLLNILNVPGFKIYALTQDYFKQITQKFFDLKKSNSLPDVTNFSFNIDLMKEEKL